MKSPERSPSAKFQGKHMCTNMHVSSYVQPTAIAIPDRPAETVVQAYLQHIYTTFGGSLAFKTDNRKEVEVTYSKMLPLNDE